jgi:hypothetical protein
VKRIRLQLNLPLLDARATILPSEKQKELSSALMELLIHAARKTCERPASGGEDEPKADQ